MKFFGIPEKTEKNIQKFSKNPKNYKTFRLSRNQEKDF